MFLHLKVFDKQVSLHSVEGNEDTVAQPLSEVVNSALDYWKREEKDIVVLNEDGDKLDLNKSAKDNELVENQLVIVTSQILIDAEEKRKKDEATKLTKSAKKKVK